MTYQMRKKKVALRVWTPKGQVLYGVILIASGVTAAGNEKRGECRVSKPRRGGRR